MMYKVPGDIKKKINLLWVINIHEADLVFCLDTNGVKHYYIHRHQTHCIQANMEYCPNKIVPQ